MLMIHGGSFTLSLLKNHQFFWVISHAVQCVSPKAQCPTIWSRAGSIQRLQLAAAVLCCKWLLFVWLWDMPVSSVDVLEYQLQFCHQPCHGPYCCHNVIKKIIAFSTVWHCGWATAVSSSDGMCLNLKKFDFPGYLQPKSVQQKDSNTCITLGIKLSPFWFSFVPGHLFSCLCYRVPYFVEHILLSSLVPCC